VANGGRRVRNYSILDRTSLHGFPLPGARRAAEEIIEHLTQRGDREYWLVPSNLTATDWLADVERIILDWGDAAAVRIHVSWEVHPTHGNALFILRGDHDTWRRDTPATR
jgi:hypothetical protein